MNRYYRAKKNIFVVSLPMWTVCVSGLLTMLSLTFRRLDFLVWFSLVPLTLYFISNDMESRKAFKAFLLYGLSFNITFLHWLFNLHPLTWMGYTTAESLILTFLAWLSLSIFESLFYAVIGYMAFFFRPAGKTVRAFLAISVILLVEWSRGLGSLGFPWGRLAISQYENTILIQGAALFGILFVSFVILLVNCLLALSVYYATEYRYRKSFILLALTVFAFMANVVFGHLELKKDTAAIDDLDVSVIQGNIPVSVKWSVSENETIRDIHFRLTREAALTYPGSDVIFWAETAVPTNLTRYPEMLSDISSLSSEVGKPLIIGANLYDELGLRNSIISVDGRGIRGMYHKRHPVPVGEYIPFKEIVFAIYPKAKDSKIAGEGLEAGTDTALLDIRGHKLGALVCYDSIFPELAREAAAEGAGILFVASNDSWYKKSSALWQHLAQSVFRAVENRRYLVRAANTGISAVISDKGRLLTVSADNREAILNHKAEVNYTHTFYTATGDLFMYIFLGAFIAFAVHPLFAGRQPRRKIRRRY